MVRIVVTSSAETGHLSPLRTPNAAEDWLVASGNSGTDPIWANGGARYLARSATGTQAGYTVEKSTTPGSPMTWRYNNAPANASEINPATADLAGLHTLLMTDNSALASAAHPTIAVDWAWKAWTAGAEFLFWIPQARTDTDGGPGVRWLQVKAQFEAWMDQVNRVTPAHLPRCRIIPGGWCFELIRQDQVNGLAPTPTFFDDLYADGFHINNNEGAYIVSAIHAAFLWGIDPQSFPNGLNAGELEHASYLKAKVSQALRTYPRAEIDTSGWA